MKVQQFWISHVQSLRLESSVFIQWKFIISRFDFTSWSGKFDEIVRHFELYFGYVPLEILAPEFDIVVHKLYILRSIEINLATCTGLLERLEGV